MTAEISAEAAPRLTLASASPRRRELLGLLGLPFDVVPSRYEEPIPETPVLLDAFVQHLAIEKAQEVAGRIQNGWVLGADTEVGLENYGIPLGKPKDTADAERMLRLLSGRAHFVCTGIALIRVYADGCREAPVSLVVPTKVCFRALTDAMIAAYAATGDPLDKAGAYGAQGLAAPFIERIEGDFFGVMGLPLCAVGKLLESQGAK